MSDNQEAYDIAGRQIALMRAEIERLRADRRERIATACLAAFLASKTWGHLGPDQMAKDAARHADALIALLDKEAKP